MRDEALTQALSRALLVLRITLGLFLLQWGVEKFVVPQNTVAIWGYFYGLNVPQTLGYVWSFGSSGLTGRSGCGWCSRWHSRSPGRSSRTLPSSSSATARPRSPSTTTATASSTQKWMCLPPRWGSCWPLACRPGQPLLSLSPWKLGSGM